MAGGRPKGYRKNPITGKFGPPDTAWSQPNEEANEENTVGVEPTLINANEEIIVYIRTKIRQAEEQVRKWEKALKELE